MALFQKSDPLKTAKRDHEKLLARLSEAETAVTTATAAADALALDGADHATLNSAEAQVRNCIDIVSRRKTALAQSDEKIAGLEAELATALDQKTRAATAATVTQMATDIETFAAEFNVVISKLIDVTARSKTFLWEATGLNEFATVCQTQTPEAVSLIASLLRSHATAVLKGSAPATIRPPDVIEPMAESEPEQLTQVFTMSAIKYTDSGGTLQYIGKWLDAELPPQIAERALRLKKAMPMSDHRRATLKGSAGGHPDPRWCFDLDVEPEPAATAEGEPVQHSAFTVIDRGPGYTLRIAK